MTDTAALRRAWGDRIRSARTERNLTQVELAERAGIGQNTVSRIESGLGGSVPTLVRLANALDIPHADLFTVESAA